MGENFAVFAIEHNHESFAAKVFLSIAKVSLLICLISLFCETFAHQNLPPL